MRDLAERAISWLKTSERSADHSNTHRTIKPTLLPGMTCL